MLYNLEVRAHKFCSLFGIFFDSEQKLDRVITAVAISKRAIDAAHWNIPKIDCSFECVQHPIVGCVCSGTIAFSSAEPNVDFGSN